ncbi:uncharacterized protein [Phaseolus vulgaris]|uniref:uncharacterized protein n=1 Tax=Phaseolus vulgaris TaxID=3885 RepID=UPI0035CC0CC2
MKDKGVPSSSAMSSSGKSSNRYNNSPPKRKTSDVKCFKCLGRGDYAAEFPTKKTMYMLSNGQIDNEPSSEEEKEDVEVELDALEGDLLMIRRLLGSKMQAMDQTQRENIFHTRCSIQGKICSLIVDGGSCTNVASSRLVTKLNLETKPHPRPYKLQWLSEDGEMTVSKQVEVNLSIGQYNDNVLCDVVPMEATHILLGRSWQFDTKAIHDGFTNKISFMQNNKKIILKPLSPREEIQTQVEELMNKGWVQETMSPCVVPVILVPKNDGYWRMCIDCRALNNITIKYRHPIPRFCTEQIAFLGFVVSAKGVQVDYEKVKAIQELCLHHVEFAYNMVVDNTSNCDPFEILYGLNPLTPIDLLTMPNISVLKHKDTQAKVDYVRKQHKKVEAQVEGKGECSSKQVNKGRKKVIFDLGDRVWVHMRKEMLTRQRKSMLQSRRDGPFQVLEMINDNAYKIDLSSKYNMSSTFNVSDLSPFISGDETLDLTSSLFQEGGNDADIQAQGPRTTRLEYLNSRPNTEYQPNHWDK